MKGSHYFDPAAGVRLMEIEQQIADFRLAQKVRAAQACNPVGTDTRRRSPPIRVWQWVMYTLKAGRGESVCPPV